MKEPDFRGPAVLAVNGEEFSVIAVLSGHLDPVDGKFHWYGRVSGDRLPKPGRSVAYLTIDTQQSARLDEIDPWGNLRVTGIGSPPYELGADPGGPSIYSREHAR